MACILAVAVVGSLSFPSLALATVRVDDTELAEGSNEVGGGTATLYDSALDMVDVTAGELYIDEDLNVNFNGGNTIDDVLVAGSAEVSLNYAGENDSDDVYVQDEANVTINANGHNEFEEVRAYDNSSVTINVTGENEFEEIEGYDNASITVRGTDCQKKDTISLGEGENDTALVTDRGNLVIDHVTVNVEGKEAVIGSQNGDVTIDTSKIEGADDNEYTEIVAGGAMGINESVVDITGTVHSNGMMTIEHSDVKVGAPDAKYDSRPYRVYSKTGVTLIREDNGEVRDGEIDGERVFYVDTEDNDGREVDLEADGEPGYYKCRGEALAPKTGDDTDPFVPIAAGIAGVATAWFASRRREAA